MSLKPEIPSGHALRKFREGLRLTGKEFAAKTGISPGHVSELETGKRRLTETQARRIATAFGLQWQEFLDRISEIPEYDLECERTPSLRDDVQTYGNKPPATKPPDALSNEYEELARNLVAKMDRIDAWKLVHDFASAAESGDSSAARCAQSLIRILSSQL